MNHGTSSLVETVEDCPFCRSTHKHTILARRQLRIVNCTECGLYYTDWRWNRHGAARYYSSGYYTGTVSGAYHDYQAERSEKLIDFHYKYKYVRRFAQGGRLLDVGCASGFSLIAAQSAGFEPEGIDFSQWSVHNAVTQLKIQQKDLVELEGRSIYGSITMWDVIQHFLNPVSCFKTLNELLCPGGVLIFTYPDPNTWAARLLGRRWPALVPEEHYFLYPAPLLYRWLERFGFQKLQECYERRFFSVGKLMQTILPRVASHLETRPIWRQVVSCRIPYKKLAVYAKAIEHDN